MGFGRHLSEEHRRKIGDARKGKSSWNLGKRLTEEHKRKIGESHKGKPLSTEHRRKMSEAREGRPLSDAHRQQLAEMHNGNRGKHRSEETKMKISQANSGRRPSDEAIRRSIETHKGQPSPFKGLKGRFSDETRRKISAAQRGRKRPPFSEGHRQKLSEFAKTRTGERSASWRGGISFEPYSPEFNSALKRQIRERDAFTCQHCGLRPAKEVHHIDYDKKHNEPENLITLCKPCHSKTNVRRSFWTGFLLGLVMGKMDSRRFAQGRSPGVEGNG